MNLKKVDWDRYRALKNKMRSGELIPKEDFQFVKVVDQTMNAQRVLRRRAVRNGWSNIAQTFRKNFK